MWWIDAICKVWLGILTVWLIIKYNVISNIANRTLFILNDVTTVN